MQVSDIRTFVPCKDFAQSQLFYQSLGFTLDTAGDDLCLAQMGDCYLFLQRYYLPEFAENMMLQIIVDDIDDAFAQIKRLPMPARYEPIKQEPWGKVIYLWGPAGELLHITELNK